MPDPIDPSIDEAVAATSRELLLDATKGLALACNALRLARESVRTASELEAVVRRSDWRAAWARACAVALATELARPDADEAVLALLRAATATFPVPRSASDECLVATLTTAVRNPERDPS